MNIPRIAEVALPISIALNESFDYRIPTNLSGNLNVGCRVLVPFRSSILIGTVIKIKNRSAYRNILKPILKSIDSEPLLDTMFLDLARTIQKKYFCSLADAINVMLPSSLKHSRKPLMLEEPDADARFTCGNLTLDGQEADFLARKETKAKLLLISDHTNQKRWMAYRALVKKTLQKQQSAIVLVPDHRKIPFALQCLNLPCLPFIVSSSIKPHKVACDWLRMRRQPFSFVVGTRSAVFAPVRNLGLVVIDEEDHFAYRQDQVPHYQAHDIACERSKGNDVRIVFGSCLPSLETLSRQELQHISLGDCDPLAAVRLIDTHREHVPRSRPKVISYVLEQHLAQTLEEKGKVLLFGHKKGFSTFLYCSHCKKTLTCPHCSSSLRHYYKESQLRCPSCSYKTPLEELCPRCQRSYVKYAGYGLEKIESEVHRLFPTAKICVYPFEKNGPSAASCDIMCASQDFLESPLHAQTCFDCVAVLGCEQMLGQVDFRCAERTFARLWQLLLLAKKELLIQSQMVDHHALSFLAKHDPEGFLRQELQERQDSSLPPSVGLACLFIRGTNQAKTLEAAEAIYKKLKKSVARIEDAETFAPVPEIPIKKRKNFWYHILIKYKTFNRLVAPIRSCLQQRRGGVIVTCDPKL
ncbi:MAG: primosomal protein N' [Candidatus Omnitrophota bacterium]